MACSLRCSVSRAAVATLLPLSVRLAKPMSVLSSWLSFLRRKDDELPPDDSTASVVVMEPPGRSQTA